MADEVTVLRLKLHALGHEAFEDGSMQPPLTIVCTDPESTAVEVRIKMDLDAQGKLHVTEEQGRISQLPPKVSVRIIDKNGKIRNIEGTK